MSVDCYPVDSFIPDGMFRFALDWMFSGVIFGKGEFVKKLQYMINFIFDIAFM